MSESVKVGLAVDAIGTGVRLEARLQLPGCKLITAHQDLTNDQVEAAKNPAEPIASALEALAQKLRAQPQEATSHDAT